MRVLVACEFSGVVRDAFIARGHDAVSVDLIASERPGPHYQGDVRDLLGHRWDLMVAHPPCTYLSNSGVRWLYQDGRGTARDVARWAAMYDAAGLFANLLGTWPAIPRVAIENPVMHRYAQEVVGPPTQSVQPWQFGHGEVKRTCLWLRGLPPLVPTDVVEGRTPRVHHAPPRADRWMDRSRTLEGIAQAMARQWG
jgi:hypothetical protein